MPLDLSRFVSCSKFFPSVHYLFPQFSWAGTEFLFSRTGKKKLAHGKTFLTANLDNYSNKTLFRLKQVKIWTWIYNLQLYIILKSMRFNSKVRFTHSTWIFSVVRIFFALACKLVWPQFWRLKEQNYTIISHRSENKPLCT